MGAKVIVITGASGGIGAALAIQLGAKGNSMVLAARREAELRGVAEQSGAESIAVVCDVRRREDIDNLKTEALKRFGRIDVWINNAGRGISKRVLEITDADFDEIMAVNLKSALYGMQAIVPYFKEQRQGHLINISSFLGRVPFVSFRSVYNAAKAALNSLTTNLRMDLKSDYPDIHVSLVMPGVVLTDFSRNALGGVPQTAPIRGIMKPQTAEEAAAAIVGLIEIPQPELYTNPALAELARQYCLDREAFFDKIRTDTPK
jgi:NAD(P)-dependent dehydrogenase (short-subunit alcohol dehydrogenase family)